MKLFQGLFAYEAVLMVLGVLLFVILVFALTWYVVKGKRIVALLPFFLLPVVMIGYPSIESIRYEKGKLEFTKLLHRLEENPLDTAARKEITVRYKQLREKYRTENDPVLLTSFAEAQLLLGNYQEAGSMASKAIALEPDYPPAKAIKYKISTELKANEEFERTINNLKKHIKSLESAESAGGSNLDSIVADLANIEPPANISNSSAIVFAKALAIAGKEESALALINRVTASQEDTVNAVRLREMIRQGRYETGVGSLDLNQENLLNANEALHVENVHRLHLNNRSERIRRTGNE